MAEKMESSKISLEFGSKKLISCNVYTLKVCNFITWAKNEGGDIGKDIDSPSFEFENAIWCFHLSYVTKYQDYFFLDIRRLKTEIPEHTVYSHVTLLDASNVVVEDFYNVSEINKSHDSGSQWDFASTSSSHDRRDTMTLIIQLFQFETEIDARQVTWMKDSPKNKAVVMTGCKLSLKSSKKTGSSDFCSLKLPNVFAAGDFDISSPTWTFAGAACCFHFISCQHGKFAVSFDVLNAEKPLQNIFIKCVLLDNNNEAIGKDFKLLKLQVSQNVRFAWFKNFSSPFCTLLVHVFGEEELRVDPVPNMRVKDLHLLPQDFKNILLSGVDYDLSLKVSEKEFHVHRAILKARSQVFETILSHKVIEKNKGIIEIQDIDGEAMELLLNYIYNGKVDSLNQNNVLKVHDAADKYKMTHLKDKCRQFMKIHNLHL